MSKHTISKLIQSWQVVSNSGFNFYKYVCQIFIKYDVFIKVIIRKDLDSFMANGISHMWPYSAPILGIILVEMTFFWPCPLPLQCQLTDYFLWKIDNLTSSVVKRFKPIKFYLRVETFDILKVEVSTSLKCQEKHTWLSVTSVSYSRNQ
jgi:hypothetical protein